MSVHAINMAGRIAVLDDGSTLPITNLFDALGEETADPREAVSFVCGSGRTWYSDQIASFEPATVH